MADYDKEAIKKILIERDDMTAEDAQCRIDACQKEIDSVNWEETGLLDLQDFIKSHFGLEPDYLDCFLENTKTMQWAQYMTRIEKLPSITLKHICVDAQEAIDAMPDGVNAGYYADEIFICGNELHQRSMNGVCREKEYGDALSQIYQILKDAGYNSFEMIDDLRDLVNDSLRPATED